MQRRLNGKFAISGIKCQNNPTQSIDLSSNTFVIKVP